MSLPGLLQKYRGRILLTLTGACGIHCRYCFRRHYDYANANPTHTNWPRTLDYLRQQHDVNEIILSGGDPLMLDDVKLATIINDLTNIPQVQRIRIHSRLLSVLPTRLTEDLLSLLTDCATPIILVTHINHPAEIDNTVAAVLQTLASNGLTLLNQAVLLHRVNDQADTLVALSETLFAAGVLPYYLHMLDPVQGAAHFDVAREQAVQLAGAMAACLPGYLVPRLVTEVPGASSKLPLPA
jgi:EF-P beta-lysylation protein EpmB